MPGDEDICKPRHSCGVLHRAEMEETHQSNQSKKSRDEAESGAESFSMDPSSATSDAPGKLNAFSIGTPHADTGVREIRELIASGKAFAVLTPISLLPQIARGTSENEMDEEIAVKVDGMTKIIMAATADAWLIHLPGTVKRHEDFTAELLAMDRSNVEDLVAVMQVQTKRKAQAAGHSFSLLAF
jgi:hypothetical protein